MTKMTTAQIKETAKANVLAQLTETLESCGAERYGSPYEVAIPTTVEGKEIWVGVVLTAKQFTETKVSMPFDPFEKRAEYDAEMEIKLKEKEERERKKAEKASKSKKK